MVSICSKKDKRFFKNLDVIYEEESKMKEICWKKIDYLRNFFKKCREIKQSPEFSTNFTEREQNQITKKNVAVANLKFIFSANQNQKIILLPLYDQNHQIFSFSDLNSFSKVAIEHEQKSALLKICYKNGKNYRDVLENKYELHHSEKALLGFIYEKSENIINQLVSEMNILNMDLQPFSSVEIQLFTFRDSCVFCESLLSCRNAIIFQKLMSDFLEITQNLSNQTIKLFSKKDQKIRKSLSFALKLWDSNDQKDANSEELKMSKNLEKDYLRKDFFSTELLFRLIKNPKIPILTFPRTFFVSIPQNIDEFDIYNKDYLINEKNAARFINSITE